MISNNGLEGMILFSIIGLLLVVYAIIVNDMMKDTYY